MESSDAGGRWERFVSNTPLRYEGNRGSAVVDVLGTATLSILCGHWRYAHINLKTEMAFGFRACLGTGWRVSVLGESFSGICSSR